MEESVEGSNKSTSNRQKLREIFQKWQYVTIGAGKSQNNVQQQSDERPEGIPPLVSRRLKISGTHCDSDEELDCRSPEPAHGVPKGYLAVYVGPTLRRFIIPTSYLSDPLFKVLLEKVEEEFGFDHTGAITIPCEIETFKYLLQCMENHQKENNIDVPAENNDTSKSPERVENSETSENNTETSLPAIDE